MKNSSMFNAYIENKPLYYKEIDHERIAKAYRLLKEHIRRPLTIHVVGTNGKGSTGRIMATLLYESNKTVGHFSSPHILAFNERIWLNGHNILDQDLEVAHQKLYHILGQDMSDALSYFEYTTLLFLVATEDLDIVVLEAGLGGEFDATNVVKKELSVITPIGLDHQDFLGDTIEKIAETKLNSIDQKVVIALQRNKVVYDVAHNISNIKGSLLHLVAREECVDLQSRVAELGWADYLYENATLALKALDILNLAYNLNSLTKVNLFGRFYEIQPNVTIDVGHNILATEALSQAIEKKYKGEKIVLVYNSLLDKEYFKILKCFKPFIKWVEIIDIDTDRAIDRRKLENSLVKLEIKQREFDQLEKGNHYFVFGSFYVIEAFLKKIKYSIKNK